VQWNVFAPDEDAGWREFVTILAGICYSPPLQARHTLAIPEGFQASLRDQPPSSTRQGLDMKTRHKWKSGNGLDTILNVLLIVLALGVLGASALEIESGVTRTAAADQQRA
jgi:hypothetical protein